MDVVLWMVFLAGAFVVLWLMRFVVVTYARDDAEGLVEADCARWDAEMCSQSPLFDDDGWLR